MDKSPLIRAAERLRQMATELSLLQANLAVPMQSCSIIDAAERLRALLGPDAYFTIRPPEMNWCGIADATVGPWSIWDGKQFHEGKTLGDALALIQAKFRPDTETAETVQAQLDQVAEQAF